MRRETSELLEPEQEPEDEEELMRTGCGLVVCFRERGAGGGTCQAHRMKSQFRSPGAWLEGAGADTRRRMSVCGGRGLTDGSDLSVRVEVVGGAWWSGARLFLMQRKGGQSGERREVGRALALIGLC